MPSHLSGTAGLLIASDVDGTLLDEQGQLPCTPAQLRSAIHTVSTRVARCTIALASSRTLRELVVLQRAIGIPGPCIAEDGAVLAVDGPSGGAQIVHHGRRALHVQQFGRAAHELRHIMRNAPAVASTDAANRSRAERASLGMGTAGAVRRGLDMREYSLLLDPSHVSDRDYRSLHSAVESNALHLRRGGKWLTLSDTPGKGPALLALREHLTAYNFAPTLVAIGNEENDISLLKVADLAFVIRNPHRGPHPALAAIPHAVVLDTEGPGGWLEMLIRLQALAP